MSKDFRHITPSDLPEHLPDANLWNNIEDQLEEMEAMSTYESLPIHKPSATIWNNIEAEINSSWAYHWNKIWYGGIAIAILLSLLFIKDYHQTNFLNSNKLISKKKENTPTNYLTITKENNEQKSNNIKQKNTPVLSSKNKQNPKKPSNKSEELTSTKTNNLKKGENIPNISQKDNLTPQIASNRKQEKTTNKEEIRNNDILFKEHFTNFIALQNNFSLKNRKTNYFDYAPKVNIKEKKHSICSTTPKEIQLEKTNTSTLKKIFYDIHYSKEIISQNYSYSDQRRANSFGLEVGYKLNSTFFQTGFNFHFVEDLAYYKIDYLKNELVRTYLKTDYIIYLPDPMNGTVEKIPVNHEEKEYDSISYSTSKNTLSNYTYMHFPLLVGYQYQYSKLSFSASIGTDFSILIEGKEPIPSIEINETRVVEIRQISSPQHSTNWHMLIGLSLQYPINKYLKIKTESQYRGEWNAYTKTQSATYVRPYSISLKTGLLINF